MEENRFKLESYNDTFCEIHDIKTDEWYKRKDLIVDLLNQQDKHIKELELLLKADKKIKTNSLNGFEKLRHENQQLKKTQKQLAIDELEKIKKFLIEKIAEKQACFDSGCYNDFADGVKTICEILVFKIEKQLKILEEL